MVTALAVAQLALPKRLGFLPLVIASAHLGNIEVLPELTTARLLIILGLGRAMFGNFAVWPNFRSKLDVCFLCFVAFGILSTLGHEPDPWVPSPFNARAGMVFNILGSYLYGRTYLPDLASFRRYAFLVPFILIPLAVCMLIEQRTQKNLYFVLGAARAEAAVRNEKVRAQGPFRHPILAGTAGATALPFVYLLWRSGRRKTALIGLASCLGVIISCASSGPMAALAVTLASILFWHCRALMKYCIWGVLLLALAYNLIKGRGPWYLMASMDLVGGSTGWHRAKLIDQGFVYLNEWWLWGSDYTRHWMATGVSWSPNHADITNYYLHLGVIGGLALPICLIGFLVLSFNLLRTRIPELRHDQDPDEIVLWCAGASLATHAVSFISISYFDQMYVFFYTLLGAIPGMVATAGSPLQSNRTASPARTEPVPVKPLRYYS